VISGYPRGPRVLSETECPTHTLPNFSAEIRSRTKCLENPTATAREDPHDGADSIRDTQAVCGFR
jgi:hypothetical protein